MKRLSENIEGSIYAAYQQYVANGMTDREARYQLVEEFGQSAENDNYASLIDTIEQSMGVDMDEPDYYLHESNKKIFSKILNESI
jgi:hypothetical protein